MKQQVSDLASIIAAAAFVTIVLVTLAGMTIPTRIIYYESSPVETATQTVLVVEHSQPHYITPEQKQLVDQIHTYATPLWFACFGILWMSIIVGAVAE